MRRFCRYGVTKYIGFGSESKVDCITIETSVCRRLIPIAAALIPMGTFSFWN